MVDNRHWAMPEITRTTKSTVLGQELQRLDDELIQLFAIASTS